MYFVVGKGCFGDHAASFFRVEIRKYVVTRFYKYMLRDVYRLNNSTMSSSSKFHKTHSLPFVLILLCFRV